MNSCHAIVHANVFLLVVATDITADTPTIDAGGPRGFASRDDCTTAVCVLPGTELAFAIPVRCSPRGLFAWTPRVVKHTTAIFRQVNKDNPRTHHDALEFPDGKMVLLTELYEDQEVTVLQLPAQPVTAAEIKAQERVRHVG